MKPSNSTQELNETLRPTKRTPFAHEALSAQERGHVDTQDEVQRLQSRLAEIDAAHEKPEMRGVIPTINSSVYAHSFTGGISGQTAFPIVGGYAATVICSATADACALGTSAVCSDYNAEIGVGYFMGPNANPTSAIGRAELACEQYGGSPNAWKVESTYQDSDPTTCTPRKDGVIPVPFGFGTIQCY